MGARGLHRGIGWAAAGFGLVLALTGIVLSLEPVTEAARTGSLSVVPDISVATLAEAVVQAVDGVERIEKTTNHTVWVHFSNDEGFGKVAFDPVALVPIQAKAPSHFWAWVKDFHRSFFLGKFGRGVAGLTALAMLGLTVSGLVLLVGRMGGWRALIWPPKTDFAQSMHLDLARIATLGLLVVSVTGVFMSLATFNLLPVGGDAFPVFPTLDGTQPALAVSDLGALKNTPLAQFRELVLPYPNDPTDAYFLTTHSGSGYVDPATGQMVSFAPLSTGQKLYELIYLLHTGQGAWWVGVLLGLSMLAVPGVIMSGLVMALRRPKSARRKIKSTPAQQADCVVLVGSEGATTWGFAANLAEQLTVAGKRVHVADMNALRSAYPKAQHLFLLTATYGQGAAPSNATRFLDRLAELQTQNMACSVLGFGDQSFPVFCQFAKDVQAACEDHGLSSFVPFTTIDRQSSQSFQAWGQLVGRAMGLSLHLDHVVSAPKPNTVTLLDRVDYGKEVQAPVSILRFQAAQGRLPAHQPGDLLGVFAPGSDIPRFYSLASNSKDGVIEICVRKQNGGLCSGLLTSMQPGQSLDVFIKPNPDFRPKRGKSPLVLIGAGAGIGPLIGFARANRGARTACLFWGGRHPGSDFLYQRELEHLQATGCLSAFTPAFSRLSGGGYVQEKLRASAADLRRSIQLGGQVMVCGGAAMGAEVRAAWDEILAPLDLSVAELKLQNRYLEDVY